MNAGEVYFAFHGDIFKPDLLTVELGLTPTRAQIKADPCPKISTWEISSGKITAEVIDVYQMAESLVQSLVPHAEAIRSAAVKYNATLVLQVVLTISLDEQLSTPAIGFSESVISFLSAVGASIDIDTYRETS